MVEQRPNAKYATPNGTSKSEANGEIVKEKKNHVTSPAIYASLVFFAAVTYFAMPHPLQPYRGEEPSIQHIFYFGWLTAISTGLGVIPLIFAPNLASYWVGISNAIAGGMMIAASYSLVKEGITFDDPHDTSTISTGLRTAAGAAIGLIFIFWTEKFLANHEDLTIGGLGGADAKRALLIFFVMTLHSFSEGVGIGVSFGGAHGSELGVFISASLAVHNIPEGLAMAVTLLPRGTTLLTGVVYAILTSIPQPIMAVPAYLFVHHFIPILPVGLGFAGGAMIWVALFELLKEAIEDSGLVTAGIVSGLSLTGMALLQGLIDDGARS
jgi:ZIP family zinc transporter